MSRSSKESGGGVAAARSLLERRIRIGATHWWDVGYEHVSTKLLPAIAILEANARSKADRRTLSCAYYNLGDIHDLTGAPLAAIDWYYRSVRIDPTHSEAFRELGCMFNWIGEWATAREMLEECLRIDPGDSDAANDLEFVLEEPPADHFDHRAGDPLWEARELIARSHCSLALKKLGRGRSNKVRQHRARAFGMLGDTERVLREWKGIAGQSGVAVLETGDWYYFPSQASDSPRLWRAFRTIGERMQGCLELHPSLERQMRKEEQLHLAEHEMTPKARHEWRFRQWQLVVQLHLARTTFDSAAVAKLSSRYPNWKEARRLAKGLSMGVSSRPPPPWILPDVRLPRRRVGGVQ